MDDIGHGVDSDGADMSELPPPLLRTLPEPSLGVGPTVLGPRTMAPQYARTGTLRQAWRRSRTARIGLSILVAGGAAVAVLVLWMLAKAML